MKPLILLFSLCLWSLLFTSLLSAQNAENNRVITDSLNTNKSLEYIDSLNKLSYEQRSLNSEEALRNALAARTMAESVDYSRGVIRANTNLGLIYQYKGDYVNSLELLQKALNLLDSFPDNNELAKVYNNLGNLYWRTNERQLAYEYYQKTMKLRTLLNDSIGLAKVLGNLGNAIGSIKGDMDSAQYFYKRALHIFEELSDSSGIAMTYSNIAGIYQAKQQYETALDYYHYALKIDQRRNDQYGISIDFSNLGALHKDMGLADSAIYYFTGLLNIANELNSLPRKRQAYNRLYGLYEDNKNYEKAFYFLKLYKAADDSLVNQTTKNRMADLQLKFDNDIKKREITLLKMESERNSLELSRKYWQILFLILLIFIVAIVAFAYWLRFKTKTRLYLKLSEQSDELSEAQSLIEERNNELLSINENLELKVVERTKELSQAYQNLLIANQRLDHFTYHSAHDLRGPVASMLGLLNLLKQEVGSGANNTASDYVDMLNATALKMNELLKRIVESHQMNLKVVHKETFSIQELLDQVVDVVNVNDQQENIKVSYQVNTLDEVYSDPSIILIILKYLVYNSILYVDKNKKDKHILIKTESSANGFYQIHILDNGIGVEPELIPNLFKMFSKGTNQAKNPGLGLYDANLLAEKINGEVYFDETDTEYTHFVLSFSTK